jgi:signal transduction histidine kinase
VADTGHGVAAEDLPRAFERFFLFDRYRSERAVGTGLGLAIVKDLAEAMGGSVQVTSAPGRGSMFTLLLPPVHTPAPVTPTPSS